MEINLIRKSGKFNFEASNEAGFMVELDAKPAIGGEGKGFRPMEMLLVGLGGCSGIDIVNVLTKQKEPLNDIEIRIKASRVTTEPPIFEEIDIQFNLFGNLNEQKVERALALTFDKYCSVANILGRSANINFSYTINSEKEVTIFPINNSKFLNTKFEEKDFSDNDIQKLSPAQKRVAILCHLPTKLIADELNISHFTVKRHLQDIKRIMGAKNIAELNKILHER